MTIKVDGEFVSIFSAKLVDDEVLRINDIIDDPLTCNEIELIESIMTDYGRCYEEYFHAARPRLVMDIVENINKKSS